MAERTLRPGLAAASPSATITESVRSALALRRPAQALELMATSVRNAGPWDAAVIAVVERGGVVAAAASHPMALSAQECQQELAQGPALAAVAEQAVVAVEDVFADGRWPLWAPVAVKLGIGAALAVPLFTDGPLGVVTFFTREASSWHPDDRGRADVIGAHVSVVVAHARMQQRLWRAIEGRTVIGQAQGILMERYRLDAEQALALLRSSALQQDTGVAVLAGQLVTTGKLGDTMINDGPPEARAASAVSRIASETGAA